MKYIYEHRNRYNNGKTLILNLFNILYKYVNNEVRMKEFKNVNSCI